MQESYKKQIEKLIQTTRDIYISQPQRIISDYNREKELTKAYNGRQVFELLQNVDDAEGQKILIKIDTEAKVFLIANTGKPFSLGGIQSLMLANASPKDKKSYIGNKGLGFRSILNWAKYVEIISNSCIVGFSEGNAKKQYEDLQLNDEVREQFRSNYREGVVPFAVLAIPDVSESIDEFSEWATVVRITYHEKFEDQIVKQLASFSEEYLLFVNHIKQLVIEGLPTGMVFNREKVSFDDHDEITVNSKKWKVYAREGKLSADLDQGEKVGDELYSVKIAINEELTNEVDKLFSFFPTEIGMKFPCIVHATFELDQSRNQIVKLDKNVFILNQLKELMVAQAEKMAHTNRPWDAFKLLTPSNSESDSDQIHEFYQDLKKKKEASCIFPGTDGELYFLSSLKYYGNEFSEFIGQFDKEVFYDLMAPMPDDLLHEKLPLKRYDDSVFASRIAKINPALTLRQRAMLIWFLCTHEFSFHKYRYSLLLDEHGNLIDSNTTCYTPAAAEHTVYDIPEFVSIAFMSMELYTCLQEIYTVDGNAPLPRELQYKIKDKVNLQPYDSNQVATRIITRTSELARYENNYATRKSYVIQMVMALWSNFLSSPKLGQYGSVIPLLDKNLEMRDADKLILTESYIGGELAGDIYQDAQTDYFMAADVVTWNLKGDLPDDELRLMITKFFMWMGVNKLTITIPYASTAANGTFYNHLISVTPDARNGMKVKVFDKEVYLIGNYISKMRLEQIVLWLLKCEKMQYALKYDADNVQLEMGNVTKSVAAKRTYILQQLIDSRKVTGYVIEEYTIPAMIANRINYKDELFIKHNINKPEIDVVLLKLGAVEKFEDLTWSQVEVLIRECPYYDKEGKHAQQLYKLALKWYAANPDANLDRHYIQYFAKLGDTFGYHGTVYYSDNQTLPKRILKDFAILHLPKRQGEDKVAALFGARNFKSIPLEISEESVSDHAINEAFQKQWLNMMDMVLAYRLENISSDRDRATAANAIRQFKIKLVKSCAYTFNNQEFEMQPNELINSGPVFYVMANPAAIRLSELQRDPEFCDSFAESLCILFKVNELKNQFRALFKSDRADSVHLINQDLSESSWRDAKRLLGLSSNEQLFWGKVFDKFDMRLTDQKLSSEVINELIRKYFDDELAKDYVPGMLDDLSSAITFSYLKRIITRLGLHSVELLSDLDSVHAFLPYHIVKINDEIKNLKSKANKAIWAKLNNADASKKSQYIDLLYDYSSKVMDVVKPLLSAYKYEFDVPYEEIVVQVICSRYDITGIETELEGLPANLYLQLESEYPDAYWSDELKSLCYFEGMEAEIRSQVKKSAPVDTAVLQDEIVGEYEVSMLSGHDFTAGSFGGSGYGSAGHKPWVAPDNMNALKNQIGKTAEKAVYKHLVAKYGEERVMWRSGYSHVPDKDDNLHYDMEYRNDEGVWKLLEVKSLSGNTFIISRKEVERACRNYKDYELALVSGGRITMVSEFFKGADPEKFETTNRYKVTPKDYYVSVNVRAQV